ncbi:hypothetical protein [Actinomadura nitritigenes]
MSSFIREADMLRPIVDNVSHFLSKDDKWEHFYEVQSPKGVVDIVLVIFDEHALEQRNVWGVQPVQERSSLEVLVAMSQAQDSSVFTTTDLAEKTLYSRSHLRRRILPSLVDLGWVNRINEREWMCTYRYKSPTASINAIEVKRSEWQRGLMQAASYTEFANKAYLAMDVTKIPKNRQSIYRSLRHAGVGLISVANNPGDQDTLAVKLEASERTKWGNARFVVAERVAAIRESGGNAGAWGHVFGRLVSTSSGEDPRNSVS